MPDSPLAVRLSSNGGAQSAGRPLAVSVEVRNVSESPLWVVGVLDGSEAGVRYPRYTPSISGPAPLRQEPLECGNVAPLRLQDFRRLMPGEGFDPTRPADGAAFLPLSAFANFRPPSPGVYEFRLTLSTESGEPREWLGLVGYPGEEEVLARLSLVPRLKVESNVLSVEVR